MSWGKNLDAKPVVWPLWNEKCFKENVQDIFLEYLQTAFTDKDCAFGKLPETVDGKPVQLEEGLYSFNNKLKGLNKDLDDISDSSSEGETLEDKPLEKPPKHKHTAKGDSGKDRCSSAARAKKQDRSSSMENKTPSPKKSIYELQCKANIMAIANNPLLKEINEDLAHMCAEHLGVPKTKPKPWPKYLDHVVPVRKLERIAITDVQREEGLSGIEEPAPSNSEVSGSDNRRSTEDKTTSVEPSNNKGDKASTCRRSCNGNSCFTHGCGC